jgi:hypothetical protein
MKFIACTLLFLCFVACCPVHSTPAPSMVPSRQPYPQTKVDPTSLVVEASLNNVVEACDHLEKALRDLDKEMNRHEEDESWNGMFMPTAPLYGNYSPADMMPIGPGLSTDFHEGPLLEPRQDVVAKDGTLINQSAASVQQILRNSRLPQGVQDGISVRWQTMQSSSDQFDQDLKKLNSFLQDPDYNQIDVSKLLKQFRQDTIDVKDQCRKIAQMLRHEG